MPVVLPTPPPGLLDATSGQPLASKARRILTAAFDQAWADPEGRTPPSRQSRTLLDAALDQIAQLLGVRREQLSLVADSQQALLSRASGRLVHSPIERSELLTAALTRPSITIGVNDVGRIDLVELGNKIQAGDSILMQAGNGEIGTLQPLEEVAQLAAANGAEVFSDFTHAIGVLPIPDGITVGANASTWGGPSGVGIVIAHEQQHSPNISVPLALAAAAALEEWQSQSQENQRLADLIDQLRTDLATIPDVDIVGDPHSRLPHILTASFLYVDGQRLMDELAKHGIYVGSGSACTSSRIEPSHVLAGIGALTHGNVRIVLPRGVQAADVKKLSDLLPGIVETVRNDLR